MNQYDNKLSEYEFYSILDQKIPGGCHDELIDVGSPRIVYLEKISMDSLGEMYEYSKDKRLYKYFEFEPHKTIGDTEKYLNKLLDRIGTDVVGRTAMYWFVRRLKDAKMVGSIGLLNIDYHRRSTEWGFAVNPEYWGKGYILEVQECVKRYAFESLRLNRIYGLTMIDNEPTKSSVLSAGAKYEGTLRQHYCKNGNFIDAWAYGILAEDYFAENDTVDKVSKGNNVSREKIANIVAKALGGCRVSVNDSMDTISNWDSLNHISIILEIEEDTGYKFSSAEIGRARSIADIYQIVSS